MVSKIDDARKRYVTQDKAVDRVCRKLGLDEDARRRVSEVVEELYAAWESDPATPPSLDGLADGLAADGDLAERVRGIGADPFLKRSNAKLYAGIAIGVALVAAVGAGLVWNAASGVAPLPSVRAQQAEKAAPESAGNGEDEEADRSAEKGDADEASAEKTGNGDKQPSDDSKSDTGRPTSSSGATSDGGSSASGSSSSKPSSGHSSGGSTGGSSGQSHTHDWVTQTSQKWVQDSAAWDEQVWVQDSAAWDETVQVGETIQCSCGATFANTAAWNAHNKDLMINQGVGHSYSVVPNYQTIHHEATGHYETVHHEATGHYETVTSGYRCSSCGATK